jgi:hypothetical protein
MEKPIEVRVRDPLRDLTRKERRNLLGVSIVSIGIVKTGLVPTEISSLGIKFGPFEQSALLKVLAACVGYFLVAFVVYAVTDWLAARWALHLAIEAGLTGELDETEKDLKDRVAALQTSEAAAKALQARTELLAYVRRTARHITAATTPILIVRNILDFAIPVGVGTYALAALIKAW